jgi:hypothetical protein
MCLIEPRRQGVRTQRAALVVVVEGCDAVWAELPHRAASCLCLPPETCPSGRGRLKPGATSPASVSGATDTSSRLRFDAVPRRNARKSVYRPISFCGARAFRRRTFPPRDLRSAIRCPRPTCAVARRYGKLASSKACCASLPGRFRASTTPHWWQGVVPDRRMTSEALVLNHDQSRHSAPLQAVSHTGQFFA